MKLYTRTGDNGQTSLIGARVAKDDIQVEAYGTVDEANSLIGQAISFLPEGEKQLKKELEDIQHQLFDCGGDLSMKAGAEEKYPYKLQAEVISLLEEKMDRYTAEAPPLERFILPGGVAAASILHVARTVIRRAERRVVTLSQRQRINQNVLQYLNRLSDYLFATARVLNYRAGHKDTQYARGAKVFHTEPTNTEK